MAFTLLFWYTMRSFSKWEISGSNKSASPAPFWSGGSGEEVGQRFDRMKKVLLR